MATNSDVRGAEYRQKALQSLDAAKGSALDQVRLRHEAAASVWNGLADLEDRRGAVAIARRSLSEQVVSGGPGVATRAQAEAA